MGDATVAPGGGSLGIEQRADLAIRGVRVAAPVFRRGRRAVRRRPPRPRRGAGGGADRRRQPVDGRRRRSPGLRRPPRRPPRRRGRRRRRLGARRAGPAGAGRAGRADPGRARGSPGVLRPHHRRRRPLPPARPAPRGRRAGHHGRPGLHPLPGGHPLPVLRHRGVAGRGHHHPGQDAGTAGRGGRGRRPARRRPPDGDDDGHLGDRRPRCPSPGPLHRRRPPGGAGPPDPGAVRAARRPGRHPRAARGRRHRHRHPRRVARRRRAPAVDAGQGHRPARRVLGGVAGGRARLRAQQGLDLPARRPR